MDTKTLEARLAELEAKLAKTEGKGVVDIREVPHSPHTDMVKQQEVYNPTNEDFTHAFNKREFTIPARGKIALPEVIAYHLATHLAKKIAQNEQHLKISNRVESSAGSDVSSEEKRLRKKKVQESIDFARGQEIMEALLDGSFKEMIIEEVKPSANEIEILKEKFEKLEKEIKEEKERKEKIKEKRLENLKKAREKKA